MISLKRTVKYFKHYFFWRKTNKILNQLKPNDSLIWKNKYNGADVKTLFIRFKKCTGLCPFTKTCNGVVVHKTMDSEIPHYTCWLNREKEIIRFRIEPNIYLTEDDFKF